MKKSVNRPLWLFLAVMPALIAALMLAGCKGNPEEPCVGCGVLPPNYCDTCPPPVEPPVEPPIEPPVEPPSVCGTVTGTDFSETAAGLNMEMVFVKCGRMKIGCTSEQVNNCEINERYEHDVELSGYYIGKYPVTQRQWAALMGANPSNFKGDDDRPVEMVSWDDAQAFIDKLNESSSGKKYRLPTEAEWEYAARGGVNSKGYVYSGGNNADGVAWYSDNSGGSVSGWPRPVGAKAPNELGLHDMSGNVREWVSDWWADRYERTPPNTLVGTPFVNPQGPETGVNRVTRGGSYAQDAVSCRVSARSYLSPELKRNFVGFRVALSAE